MLGFTGVGVLGLRRRSEQLALSGDEAAEGGGIERRSAGCEAVFPAAGVEQGLPLGGGLVGAAQSGDGGGAVEFPAMEVSDAAEDFLFGERLVAVKP